MDYDVHAFEDRADDAEDMGLSPASPRHEHEFPLLVLAVEDAEQCLALDRAQVKPPHKSGAQVDGLVEVCCHRMGQLAEKDPRKLLGGEGEEVHAPVQVPSEGERGHIVKA